MREAARIAAAISVLDAIAAGAHPEAALTGWARGARYAGSGDRRAVRDIVFDILRRRGSCAAAGGGQTGRALAIGWLRLGGRDVAALFTGARHDPAALSAQERALLARPLPAEDPFPDLPEWLVPTLIADLGAAGAARYARALRARAPVHLRVNLARTTPGQVVATLAAEGIRARPLGGAALLVEKGAPAIARSSAYASGLVELQDAHSQAVVESLPFARRVLDFCAGGGGKALALAARGMAVEAWDADPARMADLPRRAERAGARIRLLDAPEGQGAYELVLCDAPCSGSGSWRRDPAGKWRLTPDALERLCETQAAILDRAAGLVAPGGWLAWVTCSVLRAENERQVEAFLARRAGFALLSRRRWWVGAGGDGFTLALLRRL